MAHGSLVIQPLRIIYVSYKSLPYTDASGKQLIIVIFQDGKSLAFYSRKLSNAQRNYTVTEQEVCSIVDIIKEFRNILP